MTRTSGARRYRLALLFSALCGCSPATTRPPFDPLPAAPRIELELARTDAIDRVAEALRGDSVPVMRVDTRDGFLETPWFDPATGLARRGLPVGPDAVRIRAWADPGRPYHSEVTLEAVMRPVDDPSVPGRSLERLLPASHPMTARIDSLLKALVTVYGDKDLVDTTAKAKPRVTPQP
jgi:hypothetical protein